VTHSPARLLDAAAAAILAQPPAESPRGPLRVGVDLGTSKIVLLVLDVHGQPVAGRMQPANVVRDGLVVDYIGAVDRLRDMKAEVESQLGVRLSQAASGYPPGVPAPEVQAVAHVLGGAGLVCSRLVDEPTAANLVLGLRDGALVDVGGGTTGLAILKHGQVVYTADEATGGTHFNLVIAGALDMSVEDAQTLKETASEQPRLFGLVRPVMEKVGTIINRHVQGHRVPQIVLVGGASAFQGMAEVVGEITGLKVSLAPHSQLVTPLGLALADGLEPALAAPQAILDWSHA
jgi:ethanolamine utilization protein EutJ